MKKGGEIGCGVRQERQRVMAGLRVREQGF